MYINEYKGMRFDLRDPKSFEDEFRQAFGERRILGITDTVAIRVFITKSKNKVEWQIIERQILEGGHRGNQITVEVHLTGE